MPVGTGQGIQIFPFGNNTAGLVSSGRCMGVPCVRVPCGGVPCSDVPGWDSDFKALFAAGPQMWPDPEMVSSVVVG